MVAYTYTMMIEAHTTEDTMRVVTITAANGSVLQLKWQGEDANTPNPVTIYQNGTYAGVHTTAQAEKAMANARSKGMAITDEVITC